MADQEIINVLLKLENPQVLDRVERLKSEQFQIKFSGSLDQGIKDILAIKDRKISIVADVQGAINSLKQVETSLKSLQGLQEIKINLSGNIEKDLDRIGKKALELQAQLYAAELTQLGHLQNYNPKTFSGGDREIRQAQITRGINEQTAAANVRAPITQQQLDAAKTNQPVQRLVDEVTAPYNPGQIRRTQQVGELPDEKAVKRAIQARQEDILKAAEQQVISDFNSIANDLIKDISKPASGASSVRGQGVSDKFRLGQLAEDAALERQARESAAARELANNALNEQKIRQNFLAETQEPQGTGVRTPLSKVGSLIRFDNQVVAQEEFKRAEELANAQIREERLSKLRASKDQDEVDFHQEVFRGTKNIVEGISTRKAAQEASRVAQLKELGQSAALGALQGQGALSVGGSLLGSLAGAAVPGGAAFGGLVGGALGASAERTIESITRALEKAAEAGLSFETSILGISSVLQATTRVSGPGGEALSLGDQLSFQQGQARSIQKLARTKLLPLGISGDKESTLVQSIISGAAQRGIQLTPEQAATLAERLGGAIQSQRPELLGNSGQLRRDVEDLFSGAPQNTVLKTLTKGFAPGLGKATSAEDLIKRSEGLASFPETLRSSTTNPVVAAQKLNSAVDNLNTTVGDAYVTSLIPATNALAEALANPQLLDGAEKLGAAIGGVASFFTLASANLIAFTTDATRLVTSIPGAAGGLIGVAARRAIGRGSDAENNLLELQEKKRGGFFTDQREIDAQIAAAQKEFDKENIKNKVTPKASVELAKALRGSGIDDLNTSASPDLKSGAAILVSLQEARKQIQNEFKEGLDEARANNKNPTNTFNQIDLDARRRDLNSNRITQELGLSLERASALRKDSADRQSLFDTSSPLGQVNKLASDLEDRKAIRDELEETVRLAKFKRAELKEDALPEDVKKANESVRAATYELIKARNDEREAVDKLKDSELSRAKVLRDSQFDPGTVQGRSGLIQSGIKDAEARISKSSAELGDLRERLEATSDPIDRKNIQSRIEKATLEFNQGQIGRAQLSREAQNNAIDLAQGPEEVKKALLDFANSAQDAADKFTSLSNQLEKSEEALKDFQDSKALRNLNRQGVIIDAAEKALKATQGDIIGTTQIESQLPPEIANLVKGSFGFNSLARENFDRNSAVGEFERVARENTPERQAARDVRTEGDFFTSIDKTKRDLAALPGEDITRKFSNLRQLVGLQQQGVDVGAEGKDFIAKQAKELGVNLPDLKNAETLSAEIPANVASIDMTVKQILGLLGGTSGGGSTKGPLGGPLSPDKDVFSKEGILSPILGGPVGASGVLTTSGNSGLTSETPLFDLGNGFSSSVDPDVLKSGKSGSSQEELESILDSVIGSGEVSPSGNSRKITKEQAEKRLAKYAKDVFGVSNLSKDQKGILNGIGGGDQLLDAIRLKTSDGSIEGLQGQNPLFEDLNKITSGINDNPINFSDSLIARPSLPSRAYNPILREGLNEGLGNKADAKTNAVLEDVVGGFLDADVDGLKKQNRAPASGLKNGLFSGGLFGDLEGVKNGAGTDLTKFADSVGAKIDENFGKLGDIISKSLNGAI